MMDASRVRTSPQTRVDLRHGTAGVRTHATLHGSGRPSSVLHGHHAHVPAQCLTWMLHNVLLRRLHAVLCRHHPLASAGDATAVVMLGRKPGESQPRTERRTMEQLRIGDSVQVRKSPRRSPFGHPSHGALLRVSSFWHPALLLCRQLWC